MKTDFYLPYSSNLPVQNLITTLNRTTNSYKFFWFLGILEILEDNLKSGPAEGRQSDELQIEMTDIFLKMIKNAWYPLYCRVNLGVQDQLKFIVDKIKILHDLDENINEKQLEKKIKKNMSDETKDILHKLDKYVPHAFLSPWKIKNTDEKDSQDQCKRCIYSIVSENSIVIHHNWLEYLTQNLAVLKDFVYWNLFLYLQRRNPCDHFIANKLVRKEQRESLNLQRRLWDYAIDSGISIFCPYTGKKIITARKYDLDHFIPWRYICSNFMWNLTPADPSINRSKSDNLPDLDLYIEKFAFNQREIVRVLSKEKIEKKLLNNIQKIEDEYTALGISLEDLAVKDEDEIVKFYDKLIRPYFLQASSVGFSIWKFNH